LWLPVGPPHRGFQGSPPGLTHRSSEPPEGRRAAWWLPGLHRAVPSTPLDEQYEVVHSTLTDETKRLTSWTCRREPLAGEHSSHRHRLVTAGWLTLTAWTPNPAAGSSSPPTAARSRSA